MTNWTRKEELRLYRLNRLSTSNERLRSTQSQWLGFSLYQQAGRAAFISFFDYTTSIDIGNQDSEVLLLVRRRFLLEKPLLLINALQLTLGVRPISFAITDHQKKDLHETFDKIESLMVCDYRFKEEYIQELLMQLIHFLLKNSGSFGDPIKDN